MEPEIGKTSSVVRARGQGEATPGKKTPAPAAQTKPTVSQPTRPATPPPSDLKPNSRARSRSPSPAAPTSRTGTTVPLSIPEKRASQSEVKVKPEVKPDEKSVSKPEVKPVEKSVSKPEVKPQAAPKETKQYSSDLEPGRGKSKVTGRMVQGWI